MNCGKILHWYELLPLVSFLVQRARCRNCAGRIAWQYPAVELAAAFLFAGSFLRFGTSFLLPLGLISVSPLLIIFVYDLRHKIIPDRIVYCFIAAAFLFNVLSYGVSANLWVGPILAASFAFLWLISRGRWIGLGDAKLALGLGWLVGLKGALSAMLLAFWSGALVGLTLLFLKRRSFTMKSEIPFAPFLIFGTLLTLFFNLSLL